MPIPSHNIVSLDFISLASALHLPAHSLTGLAGLGKLVYDAREGLKAGVVLQVRTDEEGRVEFAEYDEHESQVLQSTGMRKRGGGEKTMGKKDVGVSNSFVGMPSTEIRKAISCFRKAIKEAVEVANAAGRIEQVIDKEQNVNI